MEFLKLFKDKLMELAKHMVLETYLGKKTIVEQGSEGDKFYFVLDGKVSIFIKSYNDMTGNEFEVTFLVILFRRNTSWTSMLAPTSASYPSFTMLPGRQR